MKPFLALTFIIAFGLTAITAGKGVDFSGTWRFNPAASKNIGMMSGMELTTIIQQSASLLIVKDMSKFSGQDSTRETRYDLTGKTVPNKSVMGENSQTVTKWSGNSLVTTWKSEGAIAGTTVTRTETRSLSSDGTKMTLESVRGSNPPIVMVFDRQ